MIISFFCSYICLFFCLNCGFVLRAGTVCLHYSGYKFLLYLSLSCHFVICVICVTVVTDD